MPGQPPDKLAGSRTGVFVGIGGFDYSNVILNYQDHLKTINAYLGTGNAHSIAANRISYLLDLRGPSVAIDTACSSSLVAIHMACESLRSAQTDLAIAGAVNLILSPEVTIAFSHARMMAADGRCKTFDAKADGYVRAEGCGAVILKRLSDALRDRDHILALVRGSAVNQDGRTAGIAAPNASAQQAVIREALAQAGVAPQRTDLHRSPRHRHIDRRPNRSRGRQGRAGKSPTPGEPPCLMGSVKANIGHLENASGMASLAKVLGCLQHDEIPGQLHFTKLNPRISLAGTRIAIPSTPQPWPRAPRRLAGISSFGFGGTNAHIDCRRSAGQVPAGRIAEPPLPHLDAFRPDGKRGQEPREPLREASCGTSRRRPRGHLLQRQRRQIALRAPRGRGRRKQRPIAGSARRLCGGAAGAKCRGGIARRTFHEKRRAAHCLSVWRGGFQCLRRVPALRHATRVSLGDGSLLAFSGFAPG